MSDKDQSDPIPTEAEDEAKQTPIDSDLVSTSSSSALVQLQMPNLVTKFAQLETATNLNVAPSNWMYNTADNVEQLQVDNDHDVRPGL